MLKSAGKCLRLHSVYVASLGQYSCAPTSFDIGCRRFLSAHFIDVATRRGGFNVTQERSRLGRMQLHGK